MFAAMPQTPPRFGFGRPGQGHHQNHRPAFPSPLSSSPVRAASLSPPPFQNQQQTVSQPLSPCNPNVLNTLPRHTQSSPTQGGQIFYPSPTHNENHNANSSSNSKLFRFASRNPRPNPVVKRREDAQEGRRRLFFQNVRQRQEDKRWERRGGEDEILKLEWWRLTRERNQAKAAEAAQYFSGMDADLAAQEEEELRMLAQQQQQYLQYERDQQQYQQQYQPQRGYADRDMDAMMADVIGQQEEAELEALVSDLERKRESAHFSDDEDYDGLFMDLIQQQQQRQDGDAGMGTSWSQDVEMT
ncbi:hypothetical protein F5144DRAFT_610439 [Chaetomium tenue]|uniref:Uncharacterized protein n=1 Tax=Chaetomium tenue TaxID=1854479 RepID=A0ACB7PLX1_9PEZI|nr:hypothetical protein F5144DRAFT_610439 [Chaetomium globosum]